MKAARAIQHERFQPSLKSYGSAGKGLRKVRCNAAMRTKELNKHYALKPDAQNLLPPSSRPHRKSGLWRAGKMAIADLHFSAPPSPCS